MGSDSKVTVWRKLLILYLALVCIIFVVVGFKEQNPRITIQAKLSGITEAEFREHKIESLDVQKVKKLFVELRIDESKSVKERTIEIPDLAYALNHHDRIRVIAKDSFEQNNVGLEESAVSEQTVIFDAGGLDEQTIRDILQSSRVAYRYRTSDGKQNTGSFAIPNLLHIEK